jgi:hypothetical protein
MPTILGANPAISADDTPRRASEAALSASAQLRAQRDAEHATILAAHARAKALSVQIVAIEREAFSRVMNQGR